MNIEYEKLLKLAEEQNKKRSYIEAEKTLLRIGREGKHDALWNYNMAYALLYLNRFKEALIFCESAIVLDSSMDAAYLLLGKLYYWKGEILKSFETVLQGRKILEKKLDKDNDNKVELSVYDKALMSIFMIRPFVNGEDIYLSVLGDHFENYSESADEEEKIGNMEEEIAKMEAFFGDYGRPRKLFSINIMAKMKDSIRYGNFEDPITYQLAMARLANWVNDEIITDKNGVVCGFKMDFEVYTDVDDYEKKFFSILSNTIPLPVGSFVEMVDEEDKKKRRVKVGYLDILSLGIPLDDICDGVRYSQVIKEVVFPVVEAFRKVYEETGEHIGVFLSEQEKISYYWMYFIGPSYDKMEEIVKEIVGEIPICNNALIKCETDVATQYDIKLEYRNYSENKV